MGWFDEQVKSRKAADRVNFDNARRSVEQAGKEETEKVKSVSFAEMKKYLMMVSDKKTMTKLLVINLLFILASAITPVLTMYVVDGQLHINLRIFLFVAAVLELVFASLKTYCLRDPEIYKGADLQEDLARKTISLPSEFFTKYSAGDIAGRIDLAGNLSSACYSGVLTGLFTGVLSLLYIIEIAWFGKSLALAGVALAVLCLAFAVPYIEANRAINHRQLKYAARESSESYSIISGIQKIRLSGSERRSYTRWGKLYSKIAGYQYNPPLVIKLSNVIICAVNTICTLILYYTTYNKSITPAQFYAATAAFALLAGAYMEFIDATENIAMLDPVIQMIKPIVDTPREAELEESDYLKLDGRIEVKDVVFSYGKDFPPVLDGISFTVNPGEYVAICGESGCGKSTLLKVLLGFLKPDSGEVLYDGKSIGEFNIKSLRKSVGTVMQDGKIFHEDIRNNVLMTAPHLDDSDAYDAIEKAQFSDDLKAMPMGLDTYLAEGNGGLSGGQRQRLLIARAIVAKPKNVILDEATSALDNITQKKVSDSLDALNCTRIVVAHRLSTIKNADKILLLSKGKIAECGSYSELIEKGGVFANLVKRQRLDL